MKALSLTLFTSYDQVQVFEKVNFKVKFTRPKVMESCERSCHKEYACEI